MIGFELITILSLVGGYFAAMDGGFPPKWMPNWIERLLCMSFVVAACVPFASWWSILALIGMVGIVTGPGQFFLARECKAINPQGIDFIVRLFFGKDWRTKFPEKHIFSANEIDYYYANVFDKLYWRCAFGLGLRGLLFALPAAILAVCFEQYEAMCYFLLTGPGTAIAYMIGYKLNRTSTAPAEWINGTIRTALVLVALRNISF